MTRSTHTAPMTRITLLPLLAVSMCTTSLVHGEGYFGVDVSTQVSPTAAACMKSEHNVTFASARAWHSYGGYDDNVKITGASFNEAGISFDVYMFPCTTSTLPSPLQQITSLLGNLTHDNVQYNRIWFDIETNTSPGCGWSSTDKNANCLFLHALISAAQNFPTVKFGVYSSMHMWDLYMSDDPNGSGCPTGNITMSGGLPLWYPHYQSPPDPSFDDFVPFGGWGGPTIKQFDDTNNLCGVGVDNNWRPTPPE